MHRVTVKFYDTTLPESQRQLFQIKTAHLATPESQGSTHYFIVHGRDFALAESKVTEFMHQQLLAAFQEDVVGLEAQEKILAEAGDDLYELSVASDAAAVAMRRYLQSRAQAEGANRLQVNSVK